MLMQRRHCVHGEKCQPLSFKQLLNCRVLHNPRYTGEQIAEHCAIKYARLKKYIAESDQAQIPFLALVRLAAFLSAWDLVDLVLQAYGRRTAPIERPASPDNPLSEAIDVNAAAAQLLSAMRDLSRAGIDEREAEELRARIRDLRRELDDVDAALTNTGAKS